MSRPRQDEVWWGEFPGGQGPSYLVVTGDQAIDVLRTVLVAPLTRTARSIPTEVSLGPDDGLPTECAATMDNALAFPRSMLVRRMGALAPEWRSAPCATWSAATGC